MNLFSINRRLVKAVLIKFLIFGLPLAILSFWGVTLFQQNNINSLITNIDKQQEELVLRDEYHFEALLKNIYDDLSLIIHSDEFYNYTTFQSASSLSDAEQMFERFLNSKMTFTQLRYISTDGNELIRANRKGDNITITKPSELQNKADRYYFQSLQQVKQGEMYISDFDLNVENGAVVIPYEPVIRLALPVYSSNSKTGFLMVNVDGIKTLEIFKDYEKSELSNLKLGLIDKNHLISLNFTDESESIESSFAENSEDFEPLYSRLDFSSDRGRFNYNGNNYFYKHIEIKDAAFEPRFDEIGDQWSIIGSYNTSAVLSEYAGFFNTHPGLRILISLFISAAVFIILIFFSKRESEHLLLLASGIISDFSHDGIMITDNSRRLIYCNPIFEDLFGYKFSEIKGKKPNEFLYGNPPIIVKDETKKDDIIWEGNVWDISADKVHIQRYLRMRTVSSSDKKNAYYIGIYSEPKIINDSDDIDLGKIPGAMLNPDSLNYLTPQLYSDFQPDADNKYAIIILRITEFAIFRNKLTENEESTLISTLSSTLKKVLKTNSVIFAPTSGLLFIAAALTKEDPVEIVMAKIDKAISSIKFTDKTCAIQYLSGVAIAPEHGSDGKELIENAYIALEAISRIKTVKYLLYNQDIYENVNQRYKIKKEIERAYENNEFTVVYQPQNDAKTRKMVGVEALVRWNNKQLGNVPPYIFIPVMEEEPTQIKRLGKHMLTKVVAECEQILPYISDDFRVSVNLSAQEFADSALIIDLISTVKKSKFPASNICFEITETVLSESLNQTNSVINILHRNDITVAIDDFGTGYSSLGYLKKLESDKLKVDRTFIKDYPENDDGSIIKAITSLAHELGMKVIVEGIETEEQLTFINKLECQEFQGYLASKPVPMDNILKMLKKELL